MNFIGIDPGVSGGIAFVSDSDVFAFAMKNCTEREVFDFIAESPGVAVLEKVASTPQMGVCSAFTFGKSYGFLRGILVGTKTPFEEVSPQKWQKEMGCLTKGDKNVSKAKAQQLFPGLKLTHATADALLLAEYARRLYHLRNGT